MKRARRHALKAWLTAHKRELFCRTCGQDHPACLVFHHLEPATKELGVADAVRRGWGRDRILAEMAKCTVLCANCHLKLHAEARDADR